MSKAATKRVPISERAAVQRINRKLGGEDNRWRTPMRVVCLRGRAADEFGKWVLVPVPRLPDVVGHGPKGPITTGRIERDNVNLEELGRELGVLRPWEEIAES